MKELKVYNLSEEFFDTVVEHYSEFVVKVEDFSKYTNGGSTFKDSIIFDGIKKIVIRESLLFKLTTEKEERNDWVQCICYKKHKQKKDVQDGISGGFAWRIMKAKIKKAGKYTEEQFDSKMKQFQAEYDAEKIQYHFQWDIDLEEETIYEYKNCRKYDINGAYAKALIDIFPEAKQAIVKLYEERKEKPENKDLINYFVGMFCVKGYRTTYNWIVQHTRKQMEEEIAECEGFLLYANTDGFAIAEAKKQLNTSKVLGEFKLEYEGKMQIFLGTNYWIIQAGDDITGSCLHQARKFVDLRKGQSVKYQRKKLSQSYTADHIQLLTNLETIKGI